MQKSRISRAIGATVAAAALALSAGCGTPTKVTDQWRDPSYQAGPVKKVVVVGVGLDPASRRSLEDRVVSDLVKKGVDAAPSYNVLGDVVPDDAQSRATLINIGYDGVLVLTLQQIAEKPRYVPGSYYGGAWGPYWWGAPGYYSPGYYVTDEIVNFEASLFDLRDGKRVWTANTKTENPSSGKDFAKSLSKEVVPDLVDQRLVAR